VDQVFALRVPLREQTLWRLVYESATPVEHLLALDVSDLDLTLRRCAAEATRVRPIGSAGASARPNCCRC
jgi:hypothetical protein